MSETNASYLVRQMDRLNSIGIALSAERNNSRLLEMILLGAKELTNADGGTLYTVTDSKQLKFEILSNNTLNMAMGGTTGVDIPFKPLNLYLPDGSPNLTTVAAYAALNDKTVNIDDAYTADSFDFSGTRLFDEKTGYHSQSFLTIPMENHEGEVIGVLQLINAIDPVSKAIVSFSPEQESLVESLASQAAVAMTNHNLIEGLKSLFEAFVTLIAEAIDQKSPYTGGHCRRVPELTMMLAQAAIDTKEGPLKDFHLTDKEFYELKIAGWLHDCGKITTPEAVMDKPTKLSALFDRIGLVCQRIELAKKQAECDALTQKLAAIQANPQADLTSFDRHLTALLAEYNAHQTFLRQVNIGNEFMSPADQAKVKAIAKLNYVDANGQIVSLLTEDEVYHLTIARGTLTKEERDIINNHIVVTINMLESLPYPKDLQRIPEYAGGHHERMDGKGHPKGLTREQMSIPARVMGIADIFEALTSKDRPYKKAKTLTESLHILGRMKLDQHIDPDLFDLFVREKIYLKYAEQFLEPEQIDDVDEASIPGYIPTSSP